MFFPPETLQALADKQAFFSSRSISSLFGADPGRVNALSFRAGELLLDASKHLIDSETLDLLCAALADKGFGALRDTLLGGGLVNNTEQRAALHTALRAPAALRPALCSGLISDCNARAAALVDRIRSDVWKGYTGKPIRTVVNIGIGGSDLGPHMATRALLALDSPYTFHFVSNIDPSDIVRVLHQCNAEETLFVVSSKTFTTFETLTNANDARAWLVAALGDEEAVKHHFVAVSTNVEKASAFGIPQENVFPMWDWVGGRYSLWSAIGLPVRLAIGNDGFEEFLAGAHAMDQHFASAPLNANLPVIMGLLGVWYRHFWHAQSHAVICYEQRLEQFPAYLQQLEMESNGKCVTRDGQGVSFDTGAILWGGVGSNTQHSFHQLLHQGTSTIPVDFLIGLVSPDPLDDQHRFLFANCLAQSHAMLAGQSETDIRADMAAKGMSTEEISRLAPHKVMPGNRPHSMLVYPKLTPSVLGQLIAAYEHKVFVQSVCWGINPFDQYGVELGKLIGLQVAEALSPTPGSQQTHFDPATQALIALYRNANNTN